MSLMTARSGIEAPTVVKPRGEAKLPHPLRRIRAVLLDVDGTLVDSNGYHVQAWREAFHSRDYFVTAQQIRSQVGKGADQLIPDLLPLVDRQEREEIAAHHDKIFASHFLRRVRPFPGAAGFVKYLHANQYHVVLASSSKEHEVNHYIQLLDIQPCLTAVTTGDDVSRSKPAPDIFEAALRKVHPAAAQACCVVGDTPYDLIAATACKMTAIALLSGGFSEDELHRERPRALYANISALWEACQSLEGGGTLGARGAIW